MRKITGMTTQTAKNRATVTTAETTAAAAAAAAAATTQKSIMTIKLSRSCNQKHKTTTTWRHSQWQYRRHLQ
jgi:3-hydroxy-3-methylglutaryl CoA synthase